MCRPSAPCELGHCYPLGPPWPLALGPPQPQQEAGGSSSVQVPHATRRASPNGPASEQTNERNQSTDPSIRCGSKPDAVFRCGDTWAFIVSPAKRWGVFLFFWCCL